MIDIQGINAALRQWGPAKGSAKGQRCATSSSGREEWPVVEIVAHSRTVTTTVSCPKMGTICLSSDPQNPRANLTGSLAEQAGLDSKVVPELEYDPKAVQESEPDA